MKIAIVFFGITRSLPFTIDSINKNIIYPAKESGDVNIFCHFFNKIKINNKRSKELGQFNEFDYQLLNPDWIQIEESDYCLERWNFDLIAKNGDSWGDQYASLKNLIHQLHSLYCVTQKALQESELVIFCRPDLQYHNNFKSYIKFFSKLDKNLIGIPFWQWYGGYNDRFSICRGREAIATYGERILKIQDYLSSTKKSLHSEIFLRAVIERSGIPIKPVSLNASRVRLGGIIHPETFSRFENMGYKNIFFNKMMNIFNHSPLF